MSLNARHAGASRVVVTMTPRPLRRELRRTTIAPRASLLEALRVIEDGGHAIVFVCDAGDRVLGTLTDGDIRRALLAGAALDSRCVMEIMTRAFASVTPAAGRAEVLDMMRARGIEQVPAIDAQGRLCGLHSLHDLMGGLERPHWAIIMAGGKGERLRPLTATVPKPMIPVAGRPILERLVLHLYSHGIRRMFLAVNHLASVIESHFGDGQRFGCRIEYLRESRPLGTGGALSLLPTPPKLPVVVLNGDLLTQFDLGRLLAFHAAGGYGATIGLKPHGVDVPFGVAKVRGHRLVELREKPVTRMLINAGIYVIEPRLLRVIPNDRAFAITEVFEHCLRRRISVGAHVIEDDWLDIGRHEELRKARGES